MNCISTARLPPRTPAGPVLRSLRLVAGMLAMVFTGMAAAQSPGGQAQVPDTIAQRAVACTACHGKEGRATSEGFFPRIAGKPVGYLYNQLVNFRDGRRKSAAMTYMVEHMSDAYLMELAQYFSSLHPPYPPPQVPNVSAATLERGRILVMSGDGAKKIPACIACHGQALTGVMPAIPGIVGLPRDYLNAQFGAWKTGARNAAAPDCMAQISKQLTPQDIGAISAWLAAQPVPDDMTPAPALSAELPIPCGSVP